MFAVQDRWLEVALAANGNDDVLPVPETNGSEYRIPLGWEPRNRSRTVTAQIDGSALGHGSGLSWQLTSGASDTGEQLPNAGLERPSLAGAVGAIPSAQTICTHYSRFTELETGVTRPEGFNCTHKASTPQLLLPGRAAAEAPAGPRMLLCAGEIQLFVTVVPLLQISPADVFSGLGEFRRQTFLLALTGVTTTLLEGLAMPGLWEPAHMAAVGHPDEYPCPNCTAATECPPATLRLVLQESTFGVTEELVRDVPAAKWGPRLLASCMSLAAIFGTAYGVIAGKMSLHKPVHTWVHAAHEEVKNQWTGRNQAMAALAKLANPTTGAFAFFARDCGSAENHGRASAGERPVLGICVVLPSKAVGELRMQPAVEGCGYTITYALGPDDTWTTMPAKSIKDAIAIITDGRVAGAAGVVLSEMIVPTDSADSASAYDSNSDTGILCKESDDIPLLPF